MTCCHSRIVNLCIIEDDEVDALVLKRLIEKQRLPYRFMHAKTLLQARDLLINNRFDIILADFDLPDGNIFTLRDISREIPIILITGLGNEEIAADAFKHDISDYLIKDLERNYLKLLPSRVESVLQKKAMSIQLSERLKEISCLYNIQKILDGKLSDTDLIQCAMRFLSEAMQFPEYVCIEIYFDGQCFYSEGYVPPDSRFDKLESKISFNNQLHGYVRVHYSVARPFLFPEEQNLISAIANEFSAYWERKEISENLQIAAISFESWDSITILDVNKRIVRVNSSCSKLLGYSEDDLYGHDYKVMCGKNTDFDSSFWDTVLAISEETGFWHGEVSLKRKNGGFLPAMLTITAIKHGSISEKIKNFVFMIRDLTPQKIAENQIHNLRYFDGLTNLPNKKNLIDTIERMIKEMAKSQKVAGLLSLDIDHFRILNDMAGHDIGDMALKQLSTRLLSCVKPYDVIARTDGDNFLILIRELDQSDAFAFKLMQMAERIRSAANQPYEIDKKEYHLTVTIGIVSIDSESTLESLIRHGNTAVSKGKKLGGNRVYFLKPSEYKEIEEMARLEFDLHHMLFDDQLRLYYQIQVDSNSNTVGVEALLRWHHPELGIVSPVKFGSI